MPFHKRYRISAFILLFVGVFACPGRDTLVLATNACPPFVIAEENHYTGFDIEIWKAIAAQQKIPYKISAAEKFEDIFTMLANAEADAAIAAISINRERESTFDFSHSYLTSGLAILTHDSIEETVIDIFKALFSPALRKIFLGMFIFIVICANLIWFFERGKDAFNDKYFPGVLEGAWWTIVTMSTVGYGDVVPKKWTGKIIAVFIIISGIAFFGIVIADLSSTIAIKSNKSVIKALTDLEGKPVASVPSTTSAELLKKHSLPFIPAKNIELAYQMLQKGQVEAVVYDRPVLQYLLGQEKRPYTVIGNFEQQSYGILLPEGSPFREKINHGLLSVMESGRYREIRQKWFDSKN